MKGLHSFGLSSWGKDLNKTKGSSIYFCLGVFYYGVY